LDVDLESKTITIYSNDNEEGDKSFVFTLYVQEPESSVSDPMPFSFEIQMIRKVVENSKIIIHNQVVAIASITIFDKTDIHPYKLVDLFPDRNISKLHLDFLSFGRTQGFMLLDIPMLELSFASDTVTTHQNGDYSISLTMSNDDGMFFKF
jgi:hypothetical protein